MRLAIVGRPNVGKSTLFNRLVGRKLAIVDDTPGVTRDRREGDGSLGPLRFRVIDTAGLEDVTDQSLEARMRKQTEEAVAGADVILFVIDARIGLTSDDIHFGRLLRQSGKPVVLIANKAEGRAAQAGILEAFDLGLGEPVPLSAEHGEGLADLAEELLPYFPEEDDAVDGEEDAPGDLTKPLQIAIIGRPNVGKSTLINRLIGEDRLLTGPEAGITRDSISIPFDWDGRPVKLMDTAGLRRRSRVVDKLERMSTADTERAVRFAEVVVLVVDAEQGIDKQDLQIADRVEQEGRAMVLALNKWDVIDKPGERLEDLRYRVTQSMAQFRGLPVVPISGRAGQGLGQLREAVDAMDRVWNTRVPTAALNRWLRDAVDRHPPPAESGRRLNPRYATQIKTRPPTFAIFMKRPGALPDTYVRYLVGSLRETFDLPGVPIRVQVRASSKNPYAD